MILLEQMCATSNDGFCRRCKQWRTMPLTVNSYAMCAGLYVSGMRLQSSLSVVRRA